MRCEDTVEALGLIEKAVLAIQARYNPDRPMFHAMDRLYAEVRRARRGAGTYEPRPRHAPP